MQYNYLKTVYVVVLTAMYLFGATPAESITIEPQEVVASQTSPQETDITNVQSNISGVKYGDLVEKYSNKYGVSYALMNAIIDTENINRAPKLQSSLYYNFTNERLGIYKEERERSFGLVQINLHYNSNITYEQATDPEFSIEFLARALSNGNHSWWASYTSGAYKKHMYKY